MIRRYELTDAEWDAMTRYLPSTVPAVVPVRTTAGHQQHRVEGSPSRGPSAGDSRGYVRCRFGRSELRADLRVASTVSRPDALESILASFAVGDGKAGPQRA